MTTHRRIDCLDDPNAPPINSIKPYEVDDPHRPVWVDVQVN